MLLQRQYSPKIIQNGFDRIMNIDRSEALKRVDRNDKSNKLTFVATFDPRLPSISSIVHKHFEHMKTTDPYLSRVFNDGVQVAYKRNKNIRDILCRARLYPIQNEKNSRPKRTVVGFKRCGKCLTCTYSTDVKNFKCSASGEQFFIKQAISCADSNVIYVICCQRCNLQYVGKTTMTFRSRMDAHRSAINGNSDTAVSKHFRLPGHKLHHLVAFPH